MNRFSRVQISNNTKTINSIPMNGGALTQRIWRSPLYSGDAFLARRTMESCYLPAGLSVKMTGKCPA